MVECDASHISFFSSPIFSFFTASAIMPTSIRKRKVSTSTATPDEETKVAQPSKKTSIPSNSQARLDPSERGIHEDAIQAGRAPTSASTCIACRKSIQRGSPRWGIKYAGNPLPQEAVIPLYGSHPMAMWCHAGKCGLELVRITPPQMMDTPATATCHACQDQPSSGIRMLCGGPNKGRKIQSHAFHVACWIRSIQEASKTDIECQTVLLSALGDHPREFLQISTTEQSAQKGNQEKVLSWDSLSSSEQEALVNDWKLFKGRD